MSYSNTIILDVCSAPSNSGVDNTGPSKLPTSNREKALGRRNKKRGGRYILHDLRKGHGPCHPTP